MIMYYQKGVYAVSMEIGPESKLHRGVANVELNQHSTIQLGLS